MKSKIASYEAAYSRIELEKTAEAYANAYGTSDGYLPHAYLSAFVAREKVAHVENMVNTFAPETQYIPAKYVNVLEKEALITPFGGMLKNTAKGLMGKVNPNSLQQLGNVETKTMYKALNSNATLGDAAKYYGAKGLGVMANNPGTTLAVGGLGLGGAGYAAMR